VIYEREMVWGSYLYAGIVNENVLPLPFSLVPDTKGSPSQAVASAPIIFSDESASASLLEANDLPKNWTVNKNYLKLDAQNDFMTDFNVKMVTITVQTHETEAVAQAAFSTKKTEAQTTVDGRGISGDELEDVKKYPLFVWNASTQVNISGVEKWTVFGV